MATIQFTCQHLEKPHGSSLATRLINQGTDRQHVFRKEFRSFLVQAVVSHSRPTCGDASVPLCSKHILIPISHFSLGLYDVWHFVGGAPKDVQAVWAHYAIGVTVDEDTGAVAPPTGAMKDMPVPSEGLSKADLDLAQHVGDQFGGGYNVGHSAPFWIVDKKGMTQLGMDSDASAADIVTNVRALLGS
jgi:hypothetical protein